MYYLEFEKMSEAIYYEKKMKKWSRAKKLAFFRKEYDKLHDLAKCRNESSSDNFEKLQKQ
ncbi:MAG: hypothetical protein U5Q03_01410 [Bacteroidota bacterium]|nr:hypothetical protein [Bacteroidota bacterium]